MALMEPIDDVCAKALEVERDRLRGDLHASITEAVAVMLLQAAGARAVLKMGDPGGAQKALDVIVDTGTMPCTAFTCYVA